ncbi:YhdP family protein [Chitinimonas koreensis]|uniref:YhdP family protein n=1 Tax=Chitinimonas koreensis TaxID=356302 RepID=UPI000402E649|nr:YhdP family protein [Chitinimonas koreensis]QNM94758.1 TIGR02099 family protein [Chitinimonas koreensis]
MSPAHSHSLRVRLVWLRRRCLRILHWHGRALVWLAALAMLLWAGGAAWLQWWLFPHLEAYRPRLVAELSERAGRPVGLERIEGGWRGTRPYLSMGGLSLYGDDGRPALTLARAEATLSWWPLLLGELRFDALTALDPDLELTRDPAGVIRLAGLPLNQGGGQGSFGDWILRQHDIAIVGGRLSWRDDLRGAPPLVLDRVDLKLENHLFGYHTLRLAATPPAALAAPFVLEAGWRGDDLARFDGWRGTLEAQLAEVDLAAWGRWLPYPVEVRRGRGRLSFELAFDGLRPSAVDSRFDLRQASLRLAPELAWLDVDTLSGQGRWSDRDGERELTLNGLRLSAEGGKLLDGGQASVSLHQRGGGELELAGLTLPALAGLPPALPLPPRWRSILQGLVPAGRIDRASLRWQGDWRDPAAPSGRAAFTGLGLAAHAPWPGVGPLDGTLDFDGQGGRVALRGQRVQLAAAELFEAPLGFDQLRLAADWRRAGAGWSVSLRDFFVRNADLQAGAQAKWDWPGEGLGTLSLRAEVARLTAAKVADYLPVVLGQDTRAWLRRSLVAGEARDARFVLDGPLAAFPFADGRQGSWRVDTRARGVTLAYADGWPAVERLDGEVRIRGNRLEIGGTGQVLGTRIERAEALIEDLAHSREIRIDGAVAGPSAEFFRFIAHSPLDATLGGLGRDAHAAGDGKLALRLDIPFEDAEATRVDGRYRFAANRLRIGEAMPDLEALRGELHFTERGADASGIAGQMLGGPLHVDIATGADHALRIDASGRADAGLAMRRYGLPLAERVTGQTDYRARVDVPAKGWKLAVEAPLREVRIDLPAPLGKPAGEVRPLQLALEADEASERWRVSVGAGGAASLGADLRRAAAGKDWRLERGEIHLGAGQPNAANRGLWLTATLPELALDPWLAVFDDGAVTDAAGGSAAPANPLDGIELRTGRLLAAGKQLDDVALRAVPQPQGAWQLTASSRQVEGRGNWAPQGRGRFYARLDRLVLPLPEAPGAAASAGATSAAGGEQRLPAVDLVADDFRFRDHALGKLELKAQPQREGWQIDSLAIANPDGQLAMSGSWRPGGEGGSSQFKVQVDSSDIGKLLGRFGYAETVRRGSGSLRGDLSWQGSPLSPDYPSLSGALTVSAQNGQFAKVEPGVGRLLGVLSLQALPRRMTLDFRDVFSEGFAFDRIEGDSKIVRGVISTDNLTVAGPAAQVLFRGEADIGRETQKIRVRIVPVVGDGVALGAGVALANPVVGVGAFLLQRVLKDPLGRLIAYEYDVTGGWADPQVARVGARPAQPQAQVQAKPR